MKLKASTVPPNLSRDLEAEIQSQKTEIQSLQRDLQSTQDSLNSWDEVNLNSIQGVYVDDSVATSTSSESQNQQSVIYSKLVVTLGCSNRESIQYVSSIEIDCSSEYATNEHFESSNGCTMRPN